MKTLLFLARFIYALHASALDLYSTVIPPPQTGFVQTQDGVHLSYRQSGPPTGQNILFIHGWRQTAAEWRKQVEYFSSAGYHVTAYDQRGHGESEYRGLAILDLRDVSIVAHSMGSSVTWAWWDQYPDARYRLSHFVIDDQSSILTADPHWNESQAAKVSALFTPLAVYDYADDLRNQTPPLLKSMFSPSISKSDYEWFLSENFKMSDENAGTLLIDHAFRDWRDVLPRITVPSLVLAGEISLNKAPGIVWVASQIPGAKNYTFTAEEKGSHFVFWENPTRFNSVVQDFITP